MSNQIANLISVVFVWGLVAYTFVFGFAKIEWTGWSGGLPWLFGVSFLFCGAAYTSKWLMVKSKGN
jgi:hypothetical protein